MTPKQKLRTTTTFVLLLGLSSGCASLTDEQRERIRAVGAALGRDSSPPPLQAVYCTTYDHGVVRNTTCTPMP